MKSKKLNISPTDHIVSVGKKCNANCIYCLTKRSKNNVEINYETGKKIVDFITSLPLKYIYLEFTGGEPFLYTKTIGNIISYFKKMTQKNKIQSHISIVSNLHNISEEELKLIIQNRITICTSLDGPKDLHNKTRKGIKDSYSKVINSLKKIIYYANKGVLEYPNIITTITKFSLNFYKEIIEEYIKLGVMRIQLGMVEPIGSAEIIWEKIGITSDDYIRFYEKALNEIFKINHDKKIPIYEKGYMLLLNSILKKKPDRKRSIPVINRLSYDTQGFIHPDDESRVLFETKNLDMILGNLNSKTQKIIDLNKLKKILYYVSSNSYDTECQKCSYSIYCYIPLWHRTISTLTLKKPSLTPKCKIFKSIFDIILYTKKNKKTKKIVENWINLYG